MKKKSRFISTLGTRPQGDKAPWSLPIAPRGTPKQRSSSIGPWPQGFLTSPADRLPSWQVNRLQGSKKASPSAVFWAFLPLCITFFTAGAPDSGTKSLHGARSRSKCVAIMAGEKQPENLIQVHLEKQTKLPFLFLRSPAIFQPDSLFSCERLNYLGRRQSYCLALDSQ